MNHTSEVKPRYKSVWLKPRSKNFIWPPHNGHVVRIKSAHSRTNPHPPPTHHPLRVFPPFPRAGTKLGHQTPEYSSKRIGPPVAFDRRPVSQNDPICVFISSIADGNSCAEAHKSFSAAWVECAFRGGFFLCELSWVCAGWVGVVASLNVGWVLFVEWRFFYVLCKMCIERDKKVRVGLKKCYILFENFNWVLCCVFVTMYCAFVLNIQLF